ncbi:MAG: AlpA family phage regulatory protein [Aestuariivirga sp.]
MAKLIPESEVRNRLANISHTTFWRIRRESDFPLPVSISPNRQGWWDNEVDAWAKARTVGVAA